MLSPREGTCFFFNLLGTLGSTSSTGNGESIQMVLKTREQGGTRLGVEHGIDGASVTVHPPFQIPPKQYEAIQQYRKLACELVPK